VQKWIAVGFMVAALGLVEAQSAEALPYSLLVNSTEVLQFNVCRGCNGAVQSNYVDVTQIINAASHGLSAGAGAQLNLTSIRQVNLCIRCIDVTQLNYASVYQVNESVYTAGGVQVNFADITQINRCIRCSDVTQVNAAEIEQVITGTGRYKFNIANIDQLNYNTGGRGISPVPEPSTIFLLSAGLLGLGAAGFRRARA